MTGPGRRDGIERCTACGSTDLFDGIWDREGFADENGRAGTVCNTCGHTQFTRRKPRTS